MKSCGNLYLVEKKSYYSEDVSMESNDGEQVDLFNYINDSWEDDFYDLDYEPIIKDKNENEPRKLTSPWKPKSNPFG